jgi:peptidoglycan/xylan/chitin deacetylase (PgdA/CDA1 family)
MVLFYCIVRMAQENIEMVRNNTLDFAKPIFILLYHSWLKGFEEYFTRHLSWLRENGFESIPLERMMQYLKGENVSIPERPIAITLDDGTIENYTIAYPLLKKYGFTGTVFVPTAEVYIRQSGKDWWKEVESEGVLKIEGHSHAHAMIFVNDQVVDFYVEQRKSEEPVTKGIDPRPGAPLFNRGYELVAKRFIPHQEFLDRCVEYVREQGGLRFIEKQNWKEEMFHLVSTDRGKRGRYETEEEKVKRIEEELKTSKEIIEESIGHDKKVHYFAYPFGAYNFDLIEHLIKLGYIGSFTTRPGGNMRGEDPYLLNRMMVLSEDSFGGIAKVLHAYL